MSRAAWRWSCTARGWSTNCTPAAPSRRAEAGALLEVLTPIAKSWPSEWCLEANSLAIQVLGGYGYTRDFPVEQYWRDNRLNMIHEGTHGIQALDLLGRKVVMDGGAALKLLAQRISATIERAGHESGLAEPASAAGRRAAGARCRHPGGLGHWRSRRGAGQRHALPAGLRPRRAGVAVAGCRAGVCGAPMTTSLPASALRCATSSPTNCRRRRLAGRRRGPRRDMPRDARRVVLNGAATNETRTRRSPGLGADLRRPARRRPGLVRPATQRRARLAADDRRRRLPRPSARC